MYIVIIECDYTYEQGNIKNKEDSHVNEKFL